MGLHETETSDNTAMDVEPQGEEHKPISIHTAVDAGKTAEHASDDDPDSHKDQPLPPLIARVLGSKSSTQIERNQDSSDADHDVGDESESEEDDSVRLRPLRSAEDSLSESMKIERSERIQSSELYKDIEDDMWPIVYSDDYNIGFFGLQKLHPFDAGKWGKIHSNLTYSQDIPVTGSQVVHPSMANTDDLLVVHSNEYLQSLESNSEVATITEVLPLAWLPDRFHWLVENRVLTPLRWQTGGTVLAAKLALERGWSMNIGGGFHHCSTDMGGGFCVYADISMALKFLFERTHAQKAMIVDLDAHQGNGHARDFMKDDRVYIMDVYNSDIYPGDRYAKEGIKKKVEIHSGTADEEYLQLVKTNLAEALEEFTPDIIIYNAGTDILQGDRLGQLNVTADGVKARDEVVFTQAVQRKIPITMVTSGGYQKQTANVVSESIINLYQKGLIHGPKPTSETQPWTLFEKIKWVVGLK